MLYHANYYHLFESAREAFLSAVRYPYKELVANRQHLVLIESHQRFVKPIRYGQSVKLDLAMVSVKKSSMVFQYQLYMGQEDEKSIVHRAWTKHAFVSQNKIGVFRPTSIPEEFIAAIEPYIERPIQS